MSIADDTTALVSAINTFGASRVKTTLGFLGGYRESLLKRTVTTVAQGVIDFSIVKANSIALTLSIANTPLSFTNVPKKTGEDSTFSLTLKLIQGTGGNLINWSALTIRWENNIAPNLSTTVGKADIIVLVTNDGGTSWDGYVSGTNR